MAGLGSFFLEIGVDSAALQRGLNNAESRLSAFGQRAEKIGTNLSLAISAPLALVGKNALQTSAQFESLEMSFGTMLRSMENGKTLMKDLQNYNLATSFQFEEVAGAGKSLLAFGFAQQQIIPQMKMIGDISAGVGINIKDLAEIYGKARVQGRLFAEDINQLTGRGIPIIAELAKQFGVSEQAVKKLTEDGKIGFNNLEQAFASMTSTGGQFFNMTANQSTTLGGLYSNLQDSVTQNLRTIGDSIVKNLDLKTVIPQASQYLTELATTFSNLSPEAQKAIVIIGGLAIVLPPLLALAGTVLPAIASGFAALISPAGLVGVAIGGAALYAITHWSELQSLIDKTSDSLYRNMLTLRHYLAKGRDLVQIGGNAKELAEIEILAYQYTGKKNAENLRKRKSSNVNTEDLGSYYFYKDGDDKDPLSDLDLDKEKRKKLLEELAKEEERILGETFSLRKTMQSQTRDLIIASMEDETKRAKAEAQKRAEDEISAMRDKMIGLKNLESEFANWRMKREESLANELVKIQRESFVVPQEIKSKGLTLPPVIRRTLSLDTDKMQSDSERGAVGKVLGMDINIEQWQSDSATYIAVAQDIENANGALKDSFKNLAVELAAQMSFIVGEMITGTASMKDLSMMITSTISQELAKIARMNIIAGIGTLISTGNPLKLLGGLAAGVGSGILSGMNKKTASMQTQRVNSQPSYSVTRGSNIYTANKQYETIRNF